MYLFNVKVGGGTKTRRPVALRMQYNPSCTVPLCFLTLENGKEEQRALADIQVITCSNVCVCVCVCACVWDCLCVSTSLDMFLISKTYSSFFTLQITLHSPLLLLLFYSLLSSHFTSAQILSLPLSFNFSSDSIRRISSLRIKDSNVTHPAASMRERLMSAWNIASALT